MIFCMMRKWYYLIELDNNLINGNADVRCYYCYDGGIVWLLIWWLFSQRPHSTLNLDDDLCLCLSHFPSHFLVPTGEWPTDGVNHDGFCHQYEAGFSSGCDWYYFILWMEEYHILLPFLWRYVLLFCIKITMQFPFMKKIIHFGNNDWKANTFSWHFHSNNSIITMDEVINDARS